ncbi:hypothetical protein [Flavobacterium sp. CLA17]|uniref:hypothetical protein n=1 Tax=Flavobacterium sp. CLA17 TaxID=2724135 RepID=UPI001491F8A2|nr:hypothetical protein [Flavobacterium sp. CLA17]QSB25664.1 hypothetical protein HAV12_014940 [Flavobacterium sp. CLA17]
MPNITFKDYEKAIRAKYEIEKEGEYAKHFHPTAQANLRDLCWERFIENKNRDDLKTFFSFFNFDFDITNTELKKALKDETDKFKTIAYFYLKEEKKTVSRYAVELAAILVDFKLRPYQNFYEKGGNEEKKINYNPFVSEIILDEEKEIAIEVISQTSQEIIKTENSHPRTTFFERLLKRSKKETAIVVGVIICLLFSTIYLAFFKKDYMQWSTDQYEVVGKEGIERNPNDIIQYDNHLLDFKKIPVCDTTTWLVNGKSIIWYAKTNNEVDFFTTCGNGRHPVSGSTIRPVTYYIFNKYKKPCGSK